MVADVFVIESLRDSRAKSLKVKIHFSVFATILQDIRGSAYHF